MANFSLYFQLMKPRIVVLLLFTGYCAMVVAHGGLPPIGTSFWTMLGLGLSAGGAHAVNMWYDRDIDAVMSRTRRRPIPTGRIAPWKVLAFGAACEGVSILILLAFVNALSMVFSLSGFLFYVFVYTMWLKRRTPQNIVIGGAAGAFPPLVGWAADTGRVSLAAVLMFLIIFLWTPPHFWALALYKNEDYRAAGVPMMPVARGAAATKWQSLFYTFLLTVASVWLSVTGAVGWVYGASAALLGILFMVYHILLLREKEPAMRWAKRTFTYSLIYLMTLFAVMVANAQIPPQIR